VKVEELVAVTREARAGLLSFLASYNPEDFSIQLSTSRGTPLHPYLADSDVDARIQPGLMLRLVDVEGALRFKTFRGEPLVLDVSDDVLPENAGEYTIGNGEVVRGAEVEERVSVDVRQLAQLYAGYLPARELARHGLIGSSSAEALSLLEVHFPVGDPWVSALDHF
jgi:predicted acetyltransferase